MHCFSVLIWLALLTVVVNCALNAWRSCRKPWYFKLTFREFNFDVLLPEGRCGMFDVRNMLCLLA